MVSVLQGSEPAQKQPVAFNYGFGLLPGLPLLNNILLSEGWKSWLRVSPCLSLHPLQKRPQHAQRIFNN